MNGAKIIGCFTFSPHCPRAALYNFPVSTLLSAGGLCDVRRGLGFLPGPGHCSGWTIKLPSAVRKDCLLAGAWGSSQRAVSVNSSPGSHWPAWVCEMGTSPTL